MCESGAQHLEGTQMIIFNVERHCFFRALNTLGGIEKTKRFANLTFNKTMLCCMPLFKLHITTRARCAKLLHNVS